MPKNGTTAASAQTDTGEGSLTRAQLHEKYTREMLQLITNNASILRSVTNADSAKAALPRLKASMARMNEVGQQVKQLGKVPKEENALLTTSLGKEILDATNSFKDELQRVLANEELKGILAELGQSN